MKALRTMALAGLLASMIISGCDCGDSDNPDAAVPEDGGVAADGGDAAVSPDGGEDGGIVENDAGVTFPDFVRDVLDNPENSVPVALPNPDLPDNEDPGEYDDQFP